MSSTMGTEPPSGQTSSLTVILIAFNSADWLPSCLGALAAAAPDAPIVVVDNASTDGSAQIARRCSPTAAIIQASTNLGFAGAANLGAKASQTDLVVLMNPDVTVGPTTLSSLAVSFGARPEAGIIGARLLYPDGKMLQHAGGEITYPLALASHHGFGEPDAGQHSIAREVGYVTGALMGIRRSVLLGLDGLDEGFYPAYFEEADFCTRARLAGWQVLYDPSVVALHHESATTGRDSSAYFHLYHRGRIRYVLKHYTPHQLWHDYYPAESTRLAGLAEEAVRSGARDELTALAIAYREVGDLLAGRESYVPPVLSPVPLSASQVLADVVGELGHRAARMLASLLEAHSSITDASPTATSSVEVSRSPEVVGAITLADEKTSEPLIGSITRAATEPPAESIVPPSSFADPEAAAVASLRALIAKARQVGQVEPSEFKSGVPFAGPVVVRFRRAWNWMATKWYVLPIVQRQNRFNSLAADTLQTIADRSEEQAASYQRTIRDARREFVELRMRVDTAEAMTRELSSSVSEIRLETLELGISSSERMVVQLTREMALVRARLAIDQARPESPPDSTARTRPEGPVADS